MPHRPHQEGLSRVACVETCLMHCCLLHGLYLVASNALKQRESFSGQAKSTEISRRQKHVACRTPGALSVNAIKVGANSSFAGGLITGVSNISTTSTDSAKPIRAGFSEFNSDGTPRASVTPRSSSYMVPPESARVERSTESQNRQALLGVQPLSVEGSGSSLLSPGTSKKVCCLSYRSRVTESAM